MLVGSRNFERGEAAPREIGAGTIELQRHVADRVSIAEAAERTREKFGRLDLLVQNAAISNTRKGSLSLQKYALSRASNASLDEVRTVWETNAFGALAVYQAIMPLLRESSDARIINVSSAVGSLTSNADPACCGRRRIVESLSVTNSVKYSNVFTAAFSFQYAAKRRFLAGTHTGYWSKPDGIRGARTAACTLTGAPEALG